MTPHAIIEYCKYKLKAKRLHGVHSPFVYTLSEDVLYKNFVPAKKVTLPSTTLSQKYLQLIDKLSEYYQCNPPLLLSSTTADDHDQHNFIILTDSNPGTWVQLFNQHLKNIGTESIIVIPSIHSTKRHSAKWRRLYTHPKILMSIDVYGLGIIIFRKDFKEKQHFILQY